MSCHLRVGPGEWGTAGNINNISKDAFKATMTEYTPMSGSLNSAFYLNEGDHDYRGRIPCRQPPHAARHIRQTGSNILEASFRRDPGRFIRI